VAYRRRFNRSFWVKPVAWLFYGVFVLAGFWYAPRNVPAKLAKFEPVAAAPQSMVSTHWWQDGWRELPARRNEFDDDQRWPLDVQVAGPLAPLQQQLERKGWTVQPQAGWQQALAMLEQKASPQDVPVLPATLDSNVEALLLLHPGTRPDEVYALRLWPSAVRLEPGQAQVWLGSAQTLRFQRHLKLFGMWRPLRGVDPALDTLKQSLDGMPNQQQVQPETGLPLLMIRSQETPAP
jgi:hypothetical protein